MNTYSNEIAQLKQHNIIKENYELVNENLIIKLSTYVEVILHKNQNTLDMYINNNHFGDISKNDITILFKSLLQDNKVFIEYRRPHGLYFKEYFKIMNLDVFKKKQKKLLVRRGTKIYTHHKLLIDLY